MNFNDLQEKVWRYIGVHQSTLRQDYMLQMIKDSANDTLTEIVQSLTYPHYHTKEYTVSLTASTSIYALDDFCYRILSAYTKDTAAHKIIWLPQSEADRSGLRNSAAVNNSNGPYLATTYQVTQTAAKSGTCNVSGTAVTWVSGSTFASTDSNKRIRLAGDDTDYVFTYSTSTTGTIDRTYQSRTTGTDTVGPLTTLTAGTFEISPAGGQQIEIVPAWGPVTQTLYVRGQRRHRRLLNSTDIPDIQEEWHYMLFAGTMYRVCLFKEDKNGASYWKGIYDEQYQKYKENDRPIVDTPIPNRIASLQASRISPNRKVFDPSAQFRNPPFIGY